MISLIKVLGMLKHKIFLPSGGLSKPRQDFEWAVSCIGRHRRSLEGGFQYTTGDDIKSSDGVLLRLCVPSAADHPSKSVCRLCLGQRHGAYDR
jgi:hypothetical protein